MAAEVTLLFQRWRQGDETALEDLMPLVYNELRRIAQIFLRNQPDHTLQPTALVHEAWLKLFQNTKPEFNDRAHMLAVMSRIMRQVLIDHARASGAAKRWGGQQRVRWDATIQWSGDGAVQLREWTADGVAGGGEPHPSKLPE